MDAVVEVDDEAVPHKNRFILGSQTAEEDSSIAFVPRCEGSFVLSSPEKKKERVMQRIPFFFDRGVATRQNCAAALFRSVSLVDDIREIALLLDRPPSFNRRSISQSVGRLPVFVWLRRLSSSSLLLSPWFAHTIAPSMVLHKFHTQHTKKEIATLVI